MIDWKRHGASTTSSPERFSWPEMSQDLPVDVLPCSNDEYFPLPPSAEQLAIMDAANRETERWRTKFARAGRLARNAARPRSKLGLPGPDQT